MFEHWQTSIAGVAMLLCATALYIWAKTPEATATAAALAVGGIGLLRASDARPGMPPPQDPPKG